MLLEHPIHVRVNAETLDQREGGFVHERIRDDGIVLLCQAEDRDRENGNGRGDRLGGYNILKITSHRTPLPYLPER